MKRMFIFKAYAEGGASRGGTSSGASRAGQRAIARNMRRAGATAEQIANAQRFARENNTRVTRTNR